MNDNNQSVQDNTTAVPQAVNDMSSPSADPSQTPMASEPPVTAAPTTMTASDDVTAPVQPMESTPAGTPEPVAVDDPTKMGQ